MSGRDAGFNFLTLRDRENSMNIDHIDLSGVNWVFVGLMMALTFVAALLGNLIAFRNRFVGAIIAAILFGIGFVAWNYYPHNFGLPILKTTALDSAAAPTTASEPPASAPASPPPGGAMAPPATTPGNSQ
jgi:hypothetical protein